MFEYLEALDQQLFLFLNGLRADWLDLPMYYLTHARYWLPVFVYLIYLFYKRFKSVKRTVIAVLFVGAAVGLADLTSARVFKPHVKRYRPTHHEVIGQQVHTVITPENKEYRGGKYGFVSSHAANFFAIATASFLLLGRARRYWWLFAWAALVSYTRIYLGVHYPADLICGGILGAAIAYILFALGRFSFGLTAGWRLPPSGR